MGEFALRRIRYCLRTENGDGGGEEHAGSLGIAPGDRVFSLNLHASGPVRIDLELSAPLCLLPQQLSLSGRRGSIPFRLRREKDQTPEAERWRVEPLVSCEDLRIRGRLSESREAWEPEEQILGLEDFFLEQYIRDEKTGSSELEHMRREVRSAQREAEMWKNRYEQIVQSRFWRFTRLPRAVFSRAGRFLSSQGGAIRPETEVPEPEARIRDSSACRGFRILFLFQNLKSSLKNQALLDFYRYCARENDAELCCLQGSPSQENLEKQGYRFTAPEAVRSFYHLIVANTASVAGVCQRWMEHEIPVLYWAEDMPDIYTTEVLRNLPAGDASSVFWACATEESGRILKMVRPGYEPFIVPYVTQVPEQDSGANAGNPGRNAGGEDETQKVWIRFLLMCIRQVHTAEIHPDSGNELYRVKALNENSRVSVIIPTCRPGEGIDGLLTVLEGQAGSPPEIILVDSGSEAWELELMRRHRVRLIQIPSGEFSHAYARNLGADAAEGDVLLFMTQDAMPPHPEWIRQMVRPILEDGICAVSPREVCPPRTDPYYEILSDLHMQSLGIRDGQDQTRERIVSLSPDEIQASCGLNDTAAAVRKDVFMRFRYRYGYGEDLDLGFRMLKAGYPIRFLGTETVLHGHNRDAMYYLKRSAVEWGTVQKKILHGRQGYGRKENLCRGAACYVRSLLDTDPMKAENGQKWLEDMLSHLQGGSMGGKIQEGSWAQTIHDPAFRAFLSELLREAPPEAGIPGVIGNLIWFLDQCVRGYMDRKGWAGPRELCEIAEKHFASLMGSELARLPEEELQGKWADYSGGV